VTGAVFAQRTRVRRIGGRGARAGGYVLTLVVVVAAWFFVTDDGLVPASTLASPTTVWTAIRGLSASGEIWSNVWTTLFRILLSFAIGCIAGIPLGALLWRFPRIGDSVRPYLAASYSIPLVVFYPMLLVVMGLNDWPVVLLTSVMTTIPISLNTALGLATAPPVLVNVARMMERSPQQIFRQVRLPAAWPDVLAGMKLSMVYAVVGVVAMEFVAASKGLGNRIQFYYESFAVASMYAFILLTLVLTGLCISLVLILEAVTTRGRR
jgi:NitT/TauT family transport system permease protein